MHVTIGFVLAVVALVVACAAIVVGFWILLGTQAGLRGTQYDMNSGWMYVITHYKRQLIAYFVLFTTPYYPDGRHRVASASVVVEQAARIERSEIRVKLSRDPLQSHNGIAAIKRSLLARAATAWPKFQLR